MLNWFCQITVRWIGCKKSSGVVNGFKNDNRFIPPTAYFSVLLGKNINDYHNNGDCLRTFYSDNVCLCPAHRQSYGYAKCDKFSNGGINIGDWVVGSCRFLDIEPNKLTLALSKKRREETTKFIFG